MIEAPASKSFTAPHSFPEKIRASPLVWLNLVCLDAPLVAVSWHWLFARSFGVVIPTGTTIALFLTAWLIYLADRLGDSMSLGQAPVLSLRQQFCLRHRGAWLATIGAILVADLLVAATQLDRVAITVGAAVGGLALTYLLINRLWPSLWHVLPLKEVSIGFIFAAGTMVGLARSLPLAALGSWLLFAALCSLNCITIAVWERDLDVGQNRVSIATEFPGIRRALLPMLGAITLTAVVSRMVAPEAGTVFPAIAASAILLAAVHLWREHIQPDARTAFADLVLLSPLVFLASQIG